MKHGKSYGKMGASSASFVNNGSPAQGSPGFINNGRGGPKSPMEFMQSGGSGPPMKRSRGFDPKSRGTSKSNVIK